jgi:hypothetical protein
MTDILNQVDATLQAVMERNAARFDLSAGGEVASGSTSACAMRWAPHAEDGIEEVPAVPEPGPLLTLADVASTAFEMRRRTPEDRQAYLAEQRARHMAHGAPEAWLACFDALAAGGDVTVMPADQFDEFMATIDEPDDITPFGPAAERHRRFTLADMEAASAAVRARRDPPTFTQAEINDWNRHQMLSLECGMHNPLCSGCDGGAIDGFSCLHDCHPLATDPRRHRAAETHARLDAHPVDELVEPAPNERITDGQGRRAAEVERRACEAVGAADRHREATEGAEAAGGQGLLTLPWWRRILGGAQ